MGQYFALESEPHSVFMGHGGGLIHLPTPESAVLRNGQANVITEKSKGQTGNIPTLLQTNPINME